MFSPVPEPAERCRVLYVSPIKALAVDIERNLRAPIAGIGRVAAARGDALTCPSISIRTGDTPARDRARFQREPTDILITTPESLFLLLTSRAREALRSVETVIVDEIHALRAHQARRAPGAVARAARGAHAATAAAHRPLGDAVGRSTRSSRFLGAVATTDAEASKA